jgi:threonine/homoserine/homoserine lactone efflux protein
MAGLGAILTASETLFTAVKWAGAAYLVWLGIGLLRAEGLAGRTAAAGAPAVIGRRRAFATGAAVMLTNPKTILFFATFLPQFIRPDAPLLPQFAILAGTLGAVELAVELALAGTAGRLAPWLTRRARLFNRITGGAFLGIGGMVALSSKG